MKKKWTSLLAIIISAVCLVISGILYFQSGLQVVNNSYEDNYIESGSGKIIEYYVAPNGSDQNAGTKAAPLKTLMGAFEKLKVNKKNIEAYNEDPTQTQKISDVNIYMADGDYYMRESDTVRIDGTYLPLGVNFTVKAEDGATPTLNGGMQITNWQQTTLNGNTVWMAQLDKGLEGIYSLSVNDKNAELANSMSSKDYDGCNLSKQNQKTHCYIDNEGSFTWDYIDINNKQQGIKVKSNVNKLNNLVNPAQTQAVWLIEWKEFMITLDNVDGDNIKSEYWKTIASIIDVASNPEWFWPNPIHNFFLQNDISLIDRAGEFCYDRESGILYYYPMAGESISNVEAYIPLTSKLMDLTTTAKKGYITNVTFDGLTFANTSVDYIDFYGGCAINQAQQFEAGAPVATGSSYTYNRAIMDAAITMNFCKNVVFSNCEFRNLGLTAVKMERGCQNCKVQGSLFKDLGNSAVVISHPNDYAPTMAMRSIGNTVENNVVRRTGQINLSAPAILVYYTEKTTILHNDIADCPYTGISVGWGWAGVKNSYANSNSIAFNKVGNHMKRLKDGGGIYTLGSQPYSTIEYNYFYSQRNNYAAIYLDEGTSGYTVSNNAVFLDGLIDENGNYLLDEDGEPWEEFYKEPVKLTWLNLNDKTEYVGTEQSPMKDIKVISNYYCAKKGFGDTISHPGNIIPPVLNNDTAHPEWNNVQLDDYDEFFGNSAVKSIIAMAGVESDYIALLERV